MVGKRKGSKKKSGKKKATQSARQKKKKLTTQTKTELEDGAVYDPGDEEMVTVRTKLVGVVANLKDRPPVPASREEFKVVSNELRDTGYGVQTASRRMAAWYPTFLEVIELVQRGLPFPDGIVRTEAQAAALFGRHSKDPNKLVSRKGFCYNCSKLIYTASGRKVAGGVRSRATDTVVAAFDSAIKRGAIYPNPKKWSGVRVPFRGEGASANTSGDVHAFYSAKFALPGKAGDEAKGAKSKVGEYFILQVTLRPRHTLPCRVDKGETLKKFAERYGVSAEEVVALNGLYVDKNGTVRSGIPVVGKAPLQTAVKQALVKKRFPPVATTKKLTMPELRIPQGKETQVGLILSPGKDGSARSRLRDIVAARQAGTPLPRLASGEVLYKKGKGWGFYVHLNCGLPVRKQPHVDGRVMAVSCSAVGMGLHYAYQEKPGRRPWYDSIGDVEATARWSLREAAQHKRLAKESRGKRGSEGGRGRKRRTQAADACGDRTSRKKRNFLRRHVKLFFDEVRKKRIGVIYMAETAGWSMAAKVAGRHGLAANQNPSGYAQQILHKAAQEGIQVRVFGKPPEKHGQVNTAYYLGLCCPACHRVDPQSKLDYRTFKCTFCGETFNAARVDLMNMFVPDICKIILADPYVVQSSPAKTKKAIAARARRKVKKVKKVKKGKKVA